MDINGVLFRLMDIKMNIEVLDLLKMSFYFPNIHYLGNLSVFFGGFLVHKSKWHKLEAPRTWTIEPGPALVDPACYSIAKYGVITQGLSHVPPGNLLSSQVTFIFVRGVETTNQLWYIMIPSGNLLSSQVTFIFVRGVETTNQLWYIMIPSGNLLQFANLNMAHKNSWFAVLKGGDFPVRKPFVYQTVNTITPVTCSTSECSSGYGHYNLYMLG